MQRMKKSKLGKSGLIKKSLRLESCSFSSRCCRRLLQMRSIMVRLTRKCSSKRSIMIAITARVVW
jgi:hypothetical protein